MQKPKQIRHNNVLVVDSEKTRAVFYHADPQRRFLGIVKGTPYMIIAMRMRCSCCGEPRATPLALGVN